MSVQTYLDGRGLDSVMLFGTGPARDFLASAGVRMADAEDADSDVRAVDEVHVVFTRFRSMLSQEPTAVRLLPLVVEDAPADYVAALRRRPCRSTGL